jgi:sortase family protein
MKAAWLYIALVGVAGVVLAACGRPPAHRAAPQPSTSAAAARPSTSAAAARPAPTTATTGIPAIPGGPTGPAHPAPSARPSVGVPVRLVVPSIGVDTGLESLGLLPDGTLEAPHEWGVAGWYADGVRPGDPGPAVIAGHVDSVNGPAVFYRLRDLRPGAAATVYPRGGPALHFVVDDVRSYPKTKFPTAAVYGPMPLPELRLITCTGEFDWAAHSYLDNLVVTARLT